MLLAARVHVTSHRTSLYPSSTMHEETVSSEHPRVLIAEDEDISRRRLCGLLRQHGMAVTEVDDGHKAIAEARDGDFDVVILDVVMPGLSGIDACKLIKSMSQEVFLPVALLTGRSDIESRVTGLRIGADDYICKPFDERELLARVHNMVRLKRKHDEVNRARTELAELSIQDGLTGLYNYRYLHSRLSEEFKRADRYKESLACLMLDVDDLKRLNETRGHHVGDSVLKEIARRLKDAVREIDVVARYGGDEFLLVLPSTGFPGALTLADRIWNAISGAPFEADSQNIPVTASLGVALFPSRDIRNKDDLVAAADRALSQSKQDGRNRICVFQHQGYIYQPR